MRFDYKLSGIGWADVEIEVDNVKYSSFPGYMSEPLHDLLDGLLSIIPNCVPKDELKNKLSFKWYQEPAVDEWNLELTDDFMLKIVIIKFEDEFCDKGEIGFQATCNLLDFIREVIKSIEQLLNTHGFVGYKNTWVNRDFPISSFLKLKYYLNFQTVYPTLKETNSMEIELQKSDLKQEINLLLDGIAEV